MELEAGPSGLCQLGQGVKRKSPPSRLSSDSESVESVYSIQNKSTDRVKDTSDTSTKDSWTCFTLGSVGVGLDFARELQEMRMRFLSPSQRVPTLVEYQPVSDEEKEPHPFGSGSESSSVPEGLAGGRIVVAESGEEDSSSRPSSSMSQGGPSESERPTLVTFGTCVTCKRVNPLPNYQYCQECYKIRKNFFPRRPIIEGGRRPRKCFLSRRRRKRQKRDDSEGSPAESGAGVGRAATTERPTSPLMDDDTPNCSNQCGICFETARNGGYAHGNTVHIVHCYQCSVKTLKTRGRCPVCNLQISQAYRVIFS